MEMRICPTCKKEKELEAFRRNTGLKNKFNKICGECIAPIKKRYAERRQDMSAYNRVYRAANKEYFSAYRKEWRKNNKELLNQWSCRKYDEDRKFKEIALIRQKLRDLISKAFEFEFILGCTFVEFREYMESKFQPGMTWDNYGRGYGKWSIDHITPLSKHENLEQANKLENLQPMWCKDNSIKGYKSV